MDALYDSAELSHGPWSMGKTAAVRGGDWPDQYHYGYGGESGEL